jgi:Ca2+/H+ antiporter, TMEM165/GDT1 family
VAFALTAVGAALAVALELLEALAIVLAVAVERRGREAAWGALAAVLACGALAVVVGPVLLARAGGDALRLVVGVALLLFGLEWLRKAVLRLAGRRARSDSYAEYVEEREALEALPPAAATSIDWPAAVIAFKGVLLEGVEVVLIVSVLAARPSGPDPALFGAALAAVGVLSAGALLRKPLPRLPETELKWGVGVLLSSFGVFFAAEGLGVEWLAGDAAILYVALALGTVSRLQAHWLARQAQPA